MKKNILLFMSIVFSLSACKKEVLTNDVKKYNKEITWAEKSVLSFDYSTALKHYDNSLKYINVPLGTDCYNALLVSIYSEEWKKASFWSRKLFEKGLELSFFESKKFNSFKNSIYWSSLIKDYPKFHQNFLETKDIELIETLTYLVKKDQEIYCSIVTTDEVDTFDAFDKTINFDNEFKTLLKKNRYLTEEKIGLNVTNDTLLNYTPIYYPLIRHSFQANDIDSFLDILKDNVDKGYLKQDVLNIATETPLSNPIVKIDSKFYVQKGLTLNGIDTKNQVAKLKFLAENHTKHFIFYVRVSGLHFNSEKEKKEFINDNNYELLTNLEL